MKLKIEPADLLIVMMGFPYLEAVLVIPINKESHCIKINQVRLGNMEMCRISLLDYIIEIGKSSSGKLLPVVCLPRPMEGMG